jgi:hypothetical protein
VYTSIVLRGAPYAFYKISFTYQKKKKKIEENSITCWTHYDSD